MTGLVELIRKRKLCFYGNFLSMDRDWLTKRIFEFFRPRKPDPKWFRKVRIDLPKMGLKEEAIIYRDNFTKQVKEFDGFQGTKKEGTDKEDRILHRRKEERSQ